MIKKVLTDDRYIFSSELSLAAALLAWEFPLYSIDKSDPKKVVFIFQKSQSVIEAVDAYWSETNLVVPKKYFNALRDVKSRIYGGQI